MYKKYLSAALFTGGKLIENSRQVLIVREDGTIEGLVPEEDAGSDVERLEGLLCPGFINAHCHLELSHLKGRIPERTGMVDFIFGVMGNRHLPVDAGKIKDEDASMWANGIQAVGDICNTADTVSAKQASPVYYHNFIEVSGFVPAGAEARFAQAKSVLEIFNHQFPSNQSSITPHAPYSVSKELFQKIDLENPSVISVHNQESQAESDFIFSKTGNLLKLYTALGADISFFTPHRQSSLRYMWPMLTKNAQKLFVHNCFTTEDDLAFLALSSQPSAPNFLCLCPNANIYIGNPLPNIKLFLQSGLQLCLGTDSLASNHQLSMIEEIKTLQQFWPGISTEALLQMATINGAKALKVDGRLGSFEKNKKPGILQIAGFENGFFTEKATVQRVA